MASWPQNISCNSLTVQPFTRFELSQSRNIVLKQHFTLSCIYYSVIPSKIFSSLWALKFLPRFIGLDCLWSWWWEHVVWELSQGHSSSFVSELPVRLLVKNCRLWTKKHFWGQKLWGFLRGYAPHHHFCVMNQLVILHVHYLSKRLVIYRINSCQSSLELAGFGR
jgi:hypothetical protein